MRTVKIVKYESGFYWIIDMETNEAIDGDKRLYVVKEMIKRWNFKLKK